MMCIEVAWLGKRSSPFYFLGAPDKIRPMDERPKLPHYDADYGLKAAKWAASTCVGILLIELLVLLFVAPNAECPGWAIYAENGRATPVWILAGIVTGGMTIEICYVVLSWKQEYSEKIHQSIAYRDERPRFPYFGFGHRAKSNPGEIQPDGRGLDFEQILFGDSNSELIIACTIWSLLCACPLLLMITMCTSVSRYLGY
jgi:hypothetical protein